MEIASNYAQIVSATGGLAGFVALGIELFSRTRLRRRPPDELLQLLARLLEDFDTMFDKRKVTHSWFLQDERRSRQVSLAIASGQIVDDELNKHVADARFGYIDAQDAMNRQVSVNQTLNDLRDDVRLKDAASKGRRACALAIDRANELMRKYRR